MISDTFYRKKKKNDKIISISKYQRDKKNEKKIKETCGLYIHESQLHI